MPLIILMRIVHVNCSFYRVRSQTGGCPGLAGAWVIIRQPGTRTRWEERGIRLQQTGGGGGGGDEDGGDEDDGYDDDSKR